MDELKSALIRVLPFAVIFVILSVRIRQGKVSAQDLDLNPPPSYSRFYLCTVGFLLFVLLTEFSLYQAGILETDRWDHPLLPSIIRIGGAVILAPVVEELLFRGFILNALCKWKPNIHLAIFIQACFFVLLHNFAYENTLTSNIGIVQGFIDASLFGYARYYTKSLYTPMAMHITGNCIATLERFIIFAP